MALTISFKGMAAAELRAARAVARRAGVGQTVFRMPDLREAGDIPGARFPGMPPTYIPFRNSIFYAVAAGLAEEVSAEFLVGGHNRDDLRIFADTGEAFFAKLQDALGAAQSSPGGGRLEIVRPLAELSKAEVVMLASRMGVPLHLTWSCHRDGRKHCWRCPGCYARRAAFEGAGVEDPLSEGNRI